MISFLRGTILDKDDETLTLDVEGVGYEVFCPTPFIEKASGSIELWISTQVREDAISLFGFGSRAEKEMFKALNKVTGIGPKMAIKIMSGAPQDRLIDMIEKGDVKNLCQLPKVGRKTAEQMVLALKGKLESAPSPHMVSPIKHEVLSALVNLGFKPSDAEKFVSTLPEEMSLEEGIRKGLAALTQI